MLFTIKCPQCGENISLLPRISKKQHKGKRQCPNCKVLIEPTNGDQVSALCGIIAAGLAVSANYLSFGSYWIRVFVLLLPTWFIMLIVMKTFMKWQVWVDGFEDSAEVKKWGRISSISTKIGLIAMLLTFANIYLLVLALKHVIPNTMYSVEHIERLVRNYMLVSYMGFAIYIILFAFSFWTLI